MLSRKSFIAKILHEPERKMKNSCHYRRGKISIKAETNDGILNAFETWQIIKFLIHSDFRRRKNSKLSKLLFNVVIMEPPNLSTISAHFIDKFYFLLIIAFN